MKTSFLTIPEISGKIYLSDKDVNHIGKREIINSATVKINPSEFSTLSSIRTDNYGEIIKEQFNIKYDPQTKSYYIEDRTSSNGTYLGSLNLKQTQAQKLKDGDAIIVPIERNGQLTQLQLIFNDSSKPVPIQDKNMTVSPEDGSVDDANVVNEFDPSQKPTIVQAKSTSSSGGEYYDPTFEPTIAPDPSDPSFYNGYDPADTSSSFILVRQKIPIPPNCFDPQVAQDAGLDFSMVYKLEKPEIWHLSVAFLMLFTMIYHTYINMMLITSLIFKWQYGDTLSAYDILVTPLPTALMFCFAFLFHELAHLYTGRHFNFQSKFCLVESGVRLTLIALLIGVPIGLPGAAVSVGIDPDTDKNKMGAIKMAGPAMNLIFGALCLIASLLIPQSLELLKTVSLQGAGLNFMLGAFNMIPKEFKGFAMDGKFIIKWKKGLYIALVAALLLGYVGVMLLTT
ncbi:MAG: FHA domain-containing protein [Promethearchaeota archaeon]